MISNFKKLFFISSLSILILSQGKIVIAAEKEFSNPEEALNAITQALQSPDPSKSFATIFGEENSILWDSGDGVADRLVRNNFLKMLSAGHRWKTMEKNYLVLFVGTTDWSFPIPLVKKGNGWIFDLKVGKEEVLNRRVGANELDAIRGAKDYVRAQKEYAQRDPMGNGAQYAQKIISDPGKKNGLFWVSQDQADESPIGPVVTSAEAEGYPVSEGDDPAILYHGYYYRILTEQGKAAKGGAKNYIDHGKMTQGFALISYPAKWSEAGVMTFIVNQDGEVFQKDLGKDTLKIAVAIRSFNPDKSWKPVQD